MFFYVFIWICIRYSYEEAGDRLEVAGANKSKSNKRRVRLAKTSILRGWYIGIYIEIANIKCGYMVGFEDIIVEFALEFTNLKDLAEDLRDVLFPIRGKLFTGTYKDCNIIYGGMINIFNKAITHLEESVYV